MESYLRGREPGEIPALLRAELARLGAPADAIAVEDSETAAVRSAFAWAREGDLLVLLSHAARARTLVSSIGWRLEAGARAGRCLRAEHDFLDRCCRI